MTGKLPAGLTLPADAIEPAAAVTIFIHWDDGATNDQEAIDFTLNVVAIDAAGNESEPRTMKVSDDPGFGCMVARQSPSRHRIAFVTVAALLFVTRRRRRG